MQKWEYTYDCLQVGSDDVLAHLNQMGSQGWELVSATTHLSSGIVNYTFFFKRPKA